MEDNSILEPLKMYNSQFKEAIKENAGKYFDKLTKTSAINVEENEELCKKYDAKLKEIETVNNVLGKKKGLKGFFIFLIVLSFILTIVFLYVGVIAIKDSSIVIPSYADFILAAVFLGLGIFLIVWIVKKINPVIKEQNLLKEKKEKEAEDLKAKASINMAPLNALFDWNMCSDVIKMTTPLIQLDRYFDMKKYQYMSEKFGLQENDDKDTSTYFVLSGSIQGNPFLIERTYNTRMSTKTYSGSITITWTTYDSKGNAQHHSQVLTATVTKPCPSYFFDTNLIYGNEAAPKLSFSRKPSNANNMNDKQLQKAVAKGEKQLKKLEEKALMDDDPSTNFTTMGNDEFDVLFGASNRNNETEFRLLFTPLAQRNELDLIKSKLPYGDDFSFYKKGMINIISSAHSQNADYYENPTTFQSYSYAISKDTFIKYNEEFFKGIYFDLAPLISIPLYQQHKPHEFIYKKFYERNFTCYESESMANSFDNKIFAHEDSKTDAILKTQLIEKNNESDKLSVMAYSYKTIERVDYISKMGGDGCVHTIPVHWDEYIPLQKETIMELSHYDSSRSKFNENMRNNKEFLNLLSNYSLNNGIIYQRGILALLLDNNKVFSNDDEKLIANMLNSTLKK